MKRLCFCFLLFLCLVTAHADPLRVFIRGGKKTHPPGAHEHEQFLNDWKVLLAERGMKVDGAMDFPSADQLAQTDVLIMHAQAAGNIAPEQRPVLEAFLKRGGGMVVIHAGAVADKPDTSPYWKSIVGGSWVQGTTKWKEGPMDLYFTENQRIGGGHPITKGASNFHLEDEIYYDMDLSPDIRVLATAYTPKVKDGKKPAEGGKAHIYDIQPQMWTYEKDDYRAFVCIPGHLYTNFARPNLRAILLRGIAWAGKRANVDEFCKPEEISSLTYPDGGPQKPAETLANLDVHPDFTMKIVAAEPLITKPMCIEWDPAGRLWVAETPEYPNGRRGMRPDYRGKEWKDHGGIDPEPGQQERKAQDKISILIDADGDGVMDKKQVFYEGLDLVTGFVFYKDGVIATQAPDILFIRDTDGDGKADKVEKLYTGLGIKDTHAVINNPRWGWDGWIYATHGYSASSDVKNVKGETQGTIGSGVVRFRPDGSKIEQYSSKGGNTWGLTITGDNRVMWTQPTSGQLLMQTVLPEYALARGKIGNTTSFKVVEPSPKSFPLIKREDLPYVQIDWVGSFTAAAGCAVYDGGTWPAEYNGDYFCTEPTINVIHHTRLTPEGSSFTAHKLPGREETEFVRSKDTWWRPIEVRVGPDGAMYVCDFYNQAVIHNDTRGPDHNDVNAAVRPDRDHYFGRIWRIDHKDAKKIAVPDLSKAGVGELAKALESPNRVVRMTASRLLVEAAQAAEKESISDKTRWMEEVAPAEKSSIVSAQVAFMWTLAGAHATGPAALIETIGKPIRLIRRNAAQIVETMRMEQGYSVNEEAVDEAMSANLEQGDGEIRVAVLRALAATHAPTFGPKVVEQLIVLWPQFQDDFQRSAAVGAASRFPVVVVSAALDRGDASLAALVTQLAQGVAEHDDFASATKLVLALAEKRRASADLERTILDTLGKSLKTAPEMTPELSAALSKLLDSSVSSSALPLAAQWDKSGALKAKVTELSGKLRIELGDAKGDDAMRLAAARSLIGIRGTNAEILPAVVAQLGADGSAGFKRQLILALGDVDDRAVGETLAGAFAKLPTEARTVAFDTLLKRADWSGAFLDVLQEKKVEVASLGPANAYRLRTHADKNVAQRASKLLDELNPLAKAKKDAIAKLMPLVEQKGDPAKGKELFNTTCAVCHNFNGFGANIGPGLTGMGSHGPSELITAIVDPNAEVDPSFVAWNLETKDGQLFNGVIESENPTTITLKSLAGVQQVKVADIRKRENTGRSLMPEGFDGLGGEPLRDIIAYMQSVDGGRFRTIDLRDAFTASTTTGLYNSQDAKKDSFEFVKAGTVKVGDIPFNIVSADKAPRNILVLKGGPEKSYSHTLLQKVDVKAGGFKANRLHFLGGVAGWGSRGGGEGADVLKVTVHTTQGQHEGMTFKNGVEFADYNAHVDVPGSKFADGIVKGSHQVRWFSRQLALGAVEIDRITIESFDNGVAPTLVAITAELADPNAPPLPSASAEPTKPGPNSGTLTLEKKADDDAGFVPQFTDPVPQPPAARPANGPRVLLVGGGSSHDFVKFMGDADKATLAPKVGWVDFTQNLNGIPAILDRIDVLVLSANQPISNATKKALIDFANAGKGIIALHPGTWYAWKNFPDWNTQIVGGGTRGHDKLGPYTVKITNADHPVTKGVTPSFDLTDELYNYNADPAANAVEVLATATSPNTGKTFPQVFVVKHAKARIVGITLGHDERAHGLPEYQALLRNAVAWAGGK
jgi:putative membrane-bound dehydrogenase-like protein